MPGISQETVLLFKAQAEQFFSTLKRMEKELGGLDKKSKKIDPLASIGDNFSKRIGEISRYYSVVGHSAKEVEEKTAAASQAIRQATKIGSKDAMQLAGHIKGIRDQMGAVGGKGAQFMRLFDNFTGGKASQTSQMLKLIGVDFAKLGLTIPVATAAIVAIGAIWKTVLGPGLEFNAMLEQQEVGFRVMLGSAEAASAMMRELKQLALTTPIGFEEGAQSTKQLFAYGFAQNEIIENMKMLGTLAAATGTTVGDLTYVYGTLRAQGQAYTRDLMQFGMRGIPIYEYLAKTLGVSVKSIKKLTEEGKIGFKEVEATIKAMTGEGGRFNNMLEEQMKTLKGQQTIMKNTWKLMQGEAAEPLEGMAKAFTESTTKLITSLGPLFAIIGQGLSNGLASLKPFYDAFVGIMQVIGIVVESIRALARLIGNALKPAVDAIKKFFGGWLDPLGKITAFLDKVLKKIKEVGRVTSEAPIEYASGFSFWPTNQAVMSETYRIADQMADAVKKRRVTSIEQLVSPEIIAEWQKTYNDINKDAAYSYEQALDSVLSVVYTKHGIRMSKEMYDDLRAGANEFAADFWNVFRRGAKSESFTGLEAFYEKGKQAAKVYIEQWENPIAQLQDSLTDMFIDPEDVSSKIKGVANEAYDTIFAALLAFKENMGDPATYLGQTKIFWDELNAALEHYAELAGKVGKVDLSAYKELKENMMDAAKYMKFRADAMNAETDLLYSQLQAYTGINELGEGTTEHLARQLAIVQYQYDLEGKSLYDKYNKKEIALDELGVQLNILGAMREQENAQKKLEEGQSLYNEQLEGSAEYWEKLQSDMGYAAKRGDYAAYAGMAAENATQGTEMGKIAAGGVPITMAITAFMEMIVSIENVAKALNPFKTALEGTKAIIEGPLNKALQPLVDALTTIGETIGVILLPIIDLLADETGALFGWMKPVLKIFMALYQALRPLNKLFFQLMNPIYFLFEILNELFTAIGMIVDATMGQAEDLEDLYDRQVKALQDLYQVGAISGKQYEAELAKLRAGTDTASSPYMVSMETTLTDLFASIKQLTEIIFRLMKALEPLLQPILDALLIVLEATVGILTPLINLIALIAALFTMDSALIAAMAKAFWDSLVKWWTTTWTNIRNFFIGIWNKLLTAINTMFGTHIELVGGTTNGREDAQSVNISYATGTSFVPNNMLANIHKGEMVVPGDFASAIRNGDLALSGSKGGSTGTVININVAGNIVTERDFYKSVGTELTKLRRQGYA